VELDTWVDLRHHDPGEIARADLLFVGGGNTFQLLDHVRRHGYEQVVRDFVAAGGDFYGGSAGAILACSDIRIAAEYDANDHRLTDLNGLGLVRDLVVLPHYDGGREIAAQRWSMNYGCAVLGIPERCGLVVRGDLLEVIGFADVFEVNGSEVTIHKPGTQ
jgi:dipeptidase E